MKHAPGLTVTITKLKSSYNCNINMYAVLNIKVIKASMLVEVLKTNYSTAHFLTQIYWLPTMLLSYVVFMVQL